MSGEQPLICIEDSESRDD